MFEGNIDPFTKKVIEFHKKKNIKEFRDYNEAALQTTIELLLPVEKWVSEMRLITKNKKPNGSNRYKFIDIFVCGLSREQQEVISKSNLVLELKVISMWGLHSGKTKKVNKNIDYDSLKALDNELKNKPENELLKMDYYFFCSEKNNYQIVTLQTILDNALKQINGYIELLKNGKVSDNKVRVVNALDGISILGGWVIMSLGSERILSRKIPFKKINYKFEFILP